MERSREASAAPETSTPLAPEDQNNFDQSLRTAVQGVGTIIRARRKAPAAAEDRISRAARELARQIDHTMRLENQALGEAGSQARVRYIEEQLRLNPSVLLTLPDDI